MLLDFGHAQLDTLVHGRAAWIDVETVDAADDVLDLGLFRQRRGGQHDLTVVGERDDRQRVLRLEFLESGVGGLLDPVQPGDARAVFLVHRAGNVEDQRQVERQRLGSPAARRDQLDQSVTGGGFAADRDTAAVHHSLDVDLGLQWCRRHGCMCSKAPDEISLELSPAPFPRWRAHDRLGIGPPVGSVRPARPERNSQSLSNTDVSARQQRRACFSELSRWSHPEQQELRRCGILRLKGSVRVSARRKTPPDCSSRTAVATTPADFRAARARRSQIGPRYSESLPALPPRSSNRPRR